MSLISDLIPKEVFNAIIKLFQLKARDRNFFPRNYKSIQEEGWPKQIAFGQVFKVRCKEDEKVYVIKKIVIDKRAVERYQYFKLLLLACQESVMLRAMGLCHGNIIRSHDELNWVVIPDNVDPELICGLAEDDIDQRVSYLNALIGTEFYMVFDCHPCDLSHVLQSSSKTPGAPITNAVALPAPDETTTIILQILNALAFLHSIGYIHGDLKPDNILVTDFRDEVLQLRVFLNDFGLSQSVSTRGALSVRIRRRNVYDAPEKEYSINIDMYAFGVLYFQMLFVCNARSRVTLAAFEMLNRIAENGDCTALRIYIREMLPWPWIDSLSVEVIVQCLQSTAKRRPSAQVLCQMISKGDPFLEACRVAAEFHRMIDPPVGTYVSEELIFPSWFKHELLEKIKVPKVSQDVVYNLTKWLEEYDFPIAQMFRFYDRAKLRDFAELMRE